MLCALEVQFQQDAITVTEVTIFDALMRHFYIFPLGKGGANVGVGTQEGALVGAALKPRAGDVHRAVDSNERRVEMMCPSPGNFTVLIATGPLRACKQGCGLAGVQVNHVDFFHRK